MLHVGNYSFIQNLVLFSPCIVCLVELIDLFYSPNLLTLNFTLLYLMQSQFGIVYWNLQCVLPRFMLLNSLIINSYCNLAVSCELTITFWVDISLAIFVPIALP